MNLAPMCDHRNLQSVASVVNFEKQPNLQAKSAYWTISFFVLLFLAFDLTFVTFIDKRSSEDGPRINDSSYTHTHTRCSADLLLETGLLKDSVSVTHWT